ncbi:hypothetical protein D3C74_371440 [compost metagenome]
MNGYRDAECGTGPVLRNIRIMNQPAVLVPGIINILLRAENISDDAFGQERAAIQFQWRRGNLRFRISIDLYVESIITAHQQSTFAGTCVLHYGIHDLRKHSIDVHLIGYRLGGFEDCRKIKVFKGIWHITRDGGFCR